MNSSFIISSVAVALLAGSGCPGGDETATLGASMRRSHVSASVEYFHGRLSPYGRWFDYAGYGWCWSPSAVPDGWRPYSDGYWVYSDLGWTWVSNEPWGWATYHYGRWLTDPYYRWVWVPDPVWAPAWVAWRMDEDWVGWAPLPPEASWQVDVGLRFESSEALPPKQWCFVRRDRIGDRDLRARLEPAGRSVALVQLTRDVTRFESAGGRPLNRGPSVEALGREPSPPVPRVRVRDVPTPDRGRGQFIGEGTVGFFRPVLRERGSRKTDASNRDDERHRRPEPLRGKRAPRGENPAGNSDAERDHPEGAGEQRGG